MYLFSFPFYIPIERLWGYRQNILPLSGPNGGPGRLTWLSLLSCWTRLIDVTKGTVIWRMWNSVLFDNNGAYVWRARVLIRIDLFTRFSRPSESKDSMNVKNPIAALVGFPSWFV